MASGEWEWGCHHLRRANELSTHHFRGFRFTMNRAPSTPARVYEPLPIDNRRGVVGFRLSVPGRRTTSAPSVRYI